MTPAQREIVSLFMEDMAEILSFGRADYQPVSRDIYAALRAALVERGTCVCEVCGKMVERSSASNT